MIDPGPDRILAVGRLAVEETRCSTGMMYYVSRYYVLLDEQTIYETGEYRDAALFVAQAQLKERADKA